MHIIFAGFFGIVLLLIAIAAFIFWIWALVDCIKNTRLTDTEKVVWVLVIIFLHFLGAFIYLLAGRDK